MWDWLWWIGIGVVVALAMAPIVYRIFLDDGGPESGIAMAALMFKAWGLAIVLAVLLLGGWAVAVIARAVGVPAGDLGWWLIFGLGAGVAVASLLQAMGQMRGVMPGLRAVWPPEPLTLIAAGAWATTLAVWWAVQGVTG